MYIQYSVCFVCAIVYAVEQQVSKPCLKKNDHNLMNFPEIWAIFDWDDDDDDEWIRFDKVLINI